MVKVSSSERRARQRAAGRQGLAAVAVACSLGLPGLVAAAGGDPPEWEPIGRMGIVQYVVVPESMARERSYYDTIIQRSCPADATCFMRFFTNSTQAPAALPLPDAIQNEPAALFQRSSKRGSEEFRFACRLQVSGALCF